MQDIHEVSPRFDAVKDSTSFVGFRNMEQLSENPVEVDFDIMHRLKQDYPSKVVIASIMGQTEEQWIELAKMAEEVPQVPSAWPNVSKNNGRKRNIRFRLARV